MLEKAMSRFGAGVVFMLIIGLFAAPISLMGAFPIMLALGVLHNDVSANVPALGYWATVIVLWGLEVFVAAVKPYRGDK